jgi:outer membrane receptor for ferrienterochelin and colicins
MIGQGSKIRVSILFLALHAFIVSARAESPSEEEGQSKEPPAESEDLTGLSLEELSAIKVSQVSGASGYAQDIKEAPSSVTIVTSDDIRKYGYRNLAEILRSIPGLFVTFDRCYSFLGIRGFGLPGDFNDRFLLLVDGHRMNDNVYDSALIGNEFTIDVDLIEKVEFIRGPSSSLYGSNAFFGVVNIITRRGQDVDGVEASSSAGSFATYKGRLTAGKLFKNGIEVLVSGSILGSDGQTLHFGEFDDPATNNGFVRDGDGEFLYGLLATVSWKDLTLQMEYGSREKHLPTALYGSAFPSTRTKILDDRGYLDLRWEHEFEDGLGLLARVFLDGYLYGADWDMEALDGSRYLNRDKTVGEWWGTEIRASKVLFGRLKLTLGGEYQDKFRQDQENFDVDPYLLIWEQERRSSFYAAYLQGDLSILENLRLNAGARYDYYDTFGDHVSPRVGLMYSPLEKTTFKLLYGQAFRAPSDFEFDPESDPGPEVIDTYEIVCEQGFWKNYKFILSGFHYEIDDLLQLEFDPDLGYDVYRNIRDRITGDGAELGLEARFKGGLRGRASYSFQHVENIGTDTRLVNSPLHLAKLNLIAPILPEKLFAGFELQYVGERKTLAGRTADDFVAANLTIFSENIVKGLEVSASVYNLFDTKYSDPGGTGRPEDLIQQDGINFQVKLTYRF